MALTRITLSPSNTSDRKSKSDQDWANRETAGRDPNQTYKRSSNDRSMMIVRSWRIRRHNTALAIERRGGRVGGGPAMLVRPVGNNQPLPWNKGLLVGQKTPLKPKHVWSIPARLEVAHMWRDLALFNLAIDSKLRACDLVKPRRRNMLGR